MGFRTIVVNAHSKLAYRSNHLVFKSAERVEMIHLSEIDVLILETMDITITSMLIKRLIDEKVTVIFCDDKRLPQSILSDIYGRYDSPLQIKRQIEWKQERKEIAWLSIVDQKLTNQAELLLNLNLTESSDRVYTMKKDLRVGDPTNVEAHGARTYFNALFGNSFSRGELTVVNGALNYGYSLILAMVSREIVVNGCLTQLGIMHVNQFNNYNLASDFMEPFRILIDEIVYENKEQPFKVIKTKILEIFEKTYRYNNQSMFLTNIIADYTRKIIAYLNEEKDQLPFFKI